MKYLLFAFTAILLDMVNCGTRNHFNNFESHLKVWPETIVLDYQKSSSGEIKVSSETPWTVTVETASGSWLEASPSSGKGDAVITVLALTSNESDHGYERTGILKISNDDLERQVIVYQRGKLTLDKYQ